MFEAVRVGQYVEENKVELDKTMRSIFDHWNKVGQLDKDEKISNKMQEIWLIGMIRILLTTAGMPKPHQKELLEGLLKSL